MRHTVLSVCDATYPADPILQSRFTRIQGVNYSARLGGNRPDSTQFSSTSGRLSNALMSHFVWRAFINDAPHGAVIPRRCSGLVKSGAGGAVIPRRCSGLVKSGAGGAVQWYHGGGAPAELRAAQRSGRSSADLHRFAPICLDNFLLHAATTHKLYSRMWSLRCNGVSLVARPPRYDGAGEGEGEGEG